VFFPNADWQKLVEHLFGSLDIGTIRPSPPYGVEASFDWLHAVAQSVGLGEEARTRLAAVREQAAERLEALRRQTAGCGVGVVIETRDLARLAHPARLSGLPLLHLLDELGVSVHVAAYDDGRGRHDAAEAALRRVLPDVARHSLSWFGDATSLRDWLADDRIRLVFSDYAYDHRVTSAGKTPVSVHAFEMGYEGALRSGERLLLLCRSRFYSRNARYLRRDR
jgi:hypothetical protein